MNIYFVSLGCDKNLVDTEHMLALLNDSGFTLTDDIDEAEIVVINTCCFIHDAMEESINNILEFAEYKTNGQVKCLVACGCLAERFTEDILKEMPEVDIIIGTNSYDEIVSAINEFFNKSAKVVVKKQLFDLPNNSKGRFKSSYGASSYLKIAEGCDKHCSYCVIPSIRGSYRSVPMEKILNEANYLVNEGIKELILVAQETTLYGIDLYEKKSLPDLLDKLNSIDGLERIRLLYCYPEEIDDLLIDAIIRNNKVAHYLDMPIQHCNDTILKRMGRLTSKQDIIDIINHLRNRIPDICLRTTLICGFPGETAEMHQELLEFIQEIKFDRLGAFPYSQEEGTPAYNFDNQVSEEDKNQWTNEVMEVQQDISLEINDSLIGKDFYVLIEGQIPEDGVFVGTTYRDTPGSDGFFFIEGASSLITGDLVKAKATKALEYDLIGELE